MRYGPSACASLHCTDIARVGRLAHTSARETEAAIPGMGRHAQLASYVHACGLLSAMAARPQEDTTLPSANMQTGHPL